MQTDEFKLTFRAAEVLSRLLDCPNHEAYGYALITGADLNTSTVYRTLRRLADDGIVLTSLVDGLPGRPQRRMYWIDPEQLGKAGALVAKYGVPR